MAKNTVRSPSTKLLLLSAFFCHSAIAQMQSAPQMILKTNPTSIHKPCAPPQYPAAALRNNVQGTTRIKFSVSEDGDVLKVELASSSGSDLLDSAAISALSGCKFKPGTRDGDPVASTTIVEYIWRIH